MQKYLQMPVDLVLVSGQDIVILKMLQKIVSYILLIEILQSEQMEIQIPMLLSPHLK